MIARLRAAGMARAMFAAAGAQAVVIVIALIVGSSTSRSARCPRSCS